MSRLSQSSINRQQYIPPHIQQSINQHLQGAMPSNLQGYMNNGTLVPKYAQKAIAKQMDKLPPHLKQYSGAYMEQHVLSPGAASFGSPAAPLQSHPPVPNLRRQDHSNLSGEQLQASFSNNLFAPDNPAPKSSDQVPSGSNNQPLPSYSEPQGSGEQSPYEFIVNPGSPRVKLNMLAGASR